MSTAEDVLFELFHMEMVNCLCNDADSNLEKAASKLEYMGFMTGFRFIERSTREHNSFNDELSTMKFICTHLWQAVFKKEIDNLRTNHQGVYVLNDNNFRFLTRIGSGKQYLEYAPRYISFGCGLIRGALANLGIASVVTADIAQLPSCKFQVQVHRS